MEIRSTQVPTIGELSVIVLDGQEFWPMQPIARALGITWQSQIAKLQQPRYLLKKVELQLPGDTRQRTHECLAVDELSFWLKTLSVKKISTGAAGKVVALQQHLAFGKSTSGSVTPKPDGPRKGVSQLNVATLERMLGWLLKRIPDTARDSGRHVVEAAFKQKLGFTIQETPEDQLPNAVSALRTFISEMRRVAKDKDVYPAMRVESLIDSIIDDAEDPLASAANLTALLNAVHLEQEKRRGVE